MKLSIPLWKAQTEEFTVEECTFIKKNFFLSDEKPADVENTFLLCPAPVVDEVGK